MIAVRLIGKQDYILESDDALDREHPDYSHDEYRRNGDKRYVPLKPGADPTVYAIEPLSRRAYAKVMNLRDNPCEMMFEAVAYGLRDVKGFVRDGNPVMLKVVKVNGLERLTEESLDKVYKPAAFIELGTRILQVSNLDP